MLYLFVNIEIIKPAYKFIKGRFIFLFLSCFSLLVLNNAYSAEPPLKENYNIVKDLNEEWLVYEKKYKEFVPFLKSRHYNYQSISQNLELENYTGYHLLLLTTSESFLFLNGNYQKKLPNSKWFEINLDSLSKAHNYPSKVLLTVFFREPKLEDLKLFVVYKSTKKIGSFFGSDNKAALKARKFSSFKNFAILLSMLLLGFTTFLYNFQDRVLIKYINFKDLFTIRNRTESIIVNRPFEIGNILFMIILSLSISLILLILEYNYVNILPSIIIKTINPNMLLLTGQFFNLSFLIFIAFILKYFFISLVGNLYQLNKITNIHFFKNLQATGIFAVFLLFIVVLFLKYPLANIQYNKAIFLYFILGFYLLRLFLLFFIIIKANPVKNLYLFSYLCIVELIPIFIGVRFAF